VGAASERHERKRRSRNSAAASPQRHPADFIHALRALLNAWL